MPILKTKKWIIEGATFADDIRILRLALLHVTAAPGLAKRIGLKPDDLYIHPDAGRCIVLGVAQVADDAKCGPEALTDMWADDVVKLTKALRQIQKGENNE